MSTLTRTFGCSYSQWPGGQRLGIHGVERGRRGPARRRVRPAARPGPPTRPGRCSRGAPRAAPRRARAASSDPLRPGSAAPRARGGPRRRGAARAPAPARRPRPGSRASVRRIAITRMPNGSARCATATPMPPKPTIPSVRPSRPPRRSKFQCSGGSWSHDVGEPLLEREHRPEHELGDRHCARAAGARDDAAGGSPARDLVDAGAAQLHPRDPLGVLEGVAPTPPNSTSPEVVVVRRVRAEVDDLDVGQHGRGAGSRPGARAR